MTIHIDGDKPQDFDNYKSSGVSSKTQQEQILAVTKLIGETVQYLGQDHDNRLGDKQAFTNKLSNSQNKFYSLVEKLSRTSPTNINNIS